MVTVQQLLNEKGKAIWTTSPNTSVFDALGVMAEKNVGALVVVEADRVVGMFSERDYARKVTLQGRHSRELSVGDIMSKDVIHITPNQTIEQCMQMMTEKHVRHLPVIDASRLVGLISIGDVVRGVIEEQRSTITHLEDYITGRKS
jgi:CBS domain-containing protein